MSHYLPRKNIKRKFSTLILLLNLLLTCGYVPSLFILEEFIISLLKQVEPLSSVGSKENR